MTELSPHATTPREPMARKAPISGLPTGACIGGYTVLAPLGTGGMGRVYLAEDEKLARKVALKVLPPEDADDEGRARFLREAQALARVHHKNVVQVFASGVDDDIAWMALEYVEGDALGALVDGGALDEETALSLCAQAARGLAAVHEVGVVHRDVKPDNLLLDENAVVRVVDFGVALFVDGARGGFVTQKGVAVGTPHFMAPEQARGGAVDARADAWGLGATLFTLLAGRPPFFEKDDEPDLDILARVLRDRAPDVREKRPGVSAATAAVVARMLEPDVDKRVSDMAALAAALDDIADALAAGQTPAPPAEPAEAAPAEAAPAEAAASTAPAAPMPATGPASAATKAPTKAPALGTFAVAALFAALGALVAFQVARAPAPSTTPAATGAPAQSDEDLAPGTASAPTSGATGASASGAANAGFGGAPANGVDEAPAGATGAPPSGAAPDGAAPGDGATGAAGTPGDPLPPDDEPGGPVAPPAGPSAGELAARVEQDLDHHRADLTALVQQDDNDAKAEVVRLAAAAGPVGDAVLDAIAAQHALQHLGAVDHALFAGSHARAVHAIDVLTELRPFEALAILDRASRTHPDKAIRAKALAARDALFHVENP